MQSLSNNFTPGAEHSLLLARLEDPRQGGINPLAVSRDEEALRTRQRRFLAATGITRGVALQVDRARRAVWMLRAGAPVPDVIHTLGYYDQAHLTHAMSRFIGRTPGQVARAEGQLSLLYKPDPL